MLKTQLEAILQAYAAVRKEQPLGGSPEATGAVKALADAILTVSAVTRRSTLKVVWGVGKGPAAAVPWVALLDSRAATSAQEGVYCAYLFRADMSGLYLVLTQGITKVRELKGRDAGSELAQRAAALRVESSGLIASGFALDADMDLRSELPRPRNYKLGTIAHKFYAAAEVPDDDSLRVDLEAVLAAYDRYLESKTGLVSEQLPAPLVIAEPKVTSIGATSPKTDLVDAFLTDATADSVGLRVTEPAILRFIAALQSKRFLILTGLAGSGKTKVAQAFARWITRDPGRIAQVGQARRKNANPCYALVPVGADWTGTENIVGYPNGLDANSYVTTPTLELVRHALNPEYESLPHFLILDEMNLSHVERYFADMLSAIESGEEIPLYEGTSRKAGSNEVPSRLRLPANLFIIGTVNVDETTYMFSPKVLDRANVLEFRMDAQELRDFLANPAAPKLEELDGKGFHYGEAFVRATTERVSGVPEAVRAEFEAEMMLFFALLREHNLEFGYRIAHEAARFVHFYQTLGGYSDDDTGWFRAAMDAVIVQKLLPKLHGSRSRLEGLLWALAWACGAPRQVTNGKMFADQVREAGLAEDENNYGPQKLWDELSKTNPAAPSEAARYTLSYDKVMRMWRRLCNDQFVTFAEA
jgi:energy-coupling factor transporter ATP-binding protein EcfA2